MPMTDAELDHTAALAAADLATAERVLAITGAGVSADSGLPTYRGVGGLYEGDVTEDGVPIEVALSAGMFARQPALTWKHIRRIEAAVRGASPNTAHRALAALEQRFPRVVVLTQNVDGFHQAAGSTDVLAIHGDLHDLRCGACGWRERVPDYAGLAAVPACPRCGAIARPDVVLFGEALPGRVVSRLRRELTAGFDAVLSIGTTSLFPYIAEPVVRAAQAGRPTVEVNPGETAVSGAIRHRFPTGAGRALSALLAALAR